MRASISQNGANRPRPKADESGKERLGLTNGDLYDMGSGAYVRKTEAKSFLRMLDRFTEELKTAIKTNADFAAEAFAYELGNYEYCVTRNPAAALEALGFTVDEVEADNELQQVFQQARKDYLAAEHWEGTP